MSRSAQPNTLTQPSDEKVCSAYLALPLRSREEALRQCDGKQQLRTVPPPETPDGQDRRARSQT